MSTEVDFMSLLSHELTTPLGAIRWNAEILRMGTMTKPLDAEQAKIVDEILVATARMNDLVTDVHEASWLERNKFGDEPTEIVLAEVISQAESNLQATIAGKKLAFTVEAESSLPKLTARLSTVLLIVQNLISNAVKYTPDAGSVHVTLRLATSDEAARATRPEAGGQSGTRQHVLLAVADTGYGIPAAQHDQVFSKFFRGDNVRALGIDGTGLGLYIVGQAITKLKGAVWFESTEQQGTTFYAVLPVSIT